MGLGRYGDPAWLGALIERARDDEAVHVAVAAADAIAVVGGEGAVAALAAMSRQEDDRGLAALRALGRIRLDSIAELLRDALRAEDSRRRLTAVEALIGNGSAAAVEALAWTATADGDAGVAGAASAGLAAIANREGAAREGAVRALVETLRDPLRRGASLNALARLAAPAIPELAKALAADDPQIRRGAVEALSRLTHPVASASLLSALGDGDAAVRRLAIIGLSRIGTRGLARRLSLLARTDPAVSVRQAAAAALNRYKDSHQGDE